MSIRSLCRSSRLRRNERRGSCSFGCMAAQERWLGVGQLSAQARGARKALNPARRGRCSTYPERAGKRLRAKANAERHRRSLLSPRLRSSLPAALRKVSRSIRILPQHPMMDSCAKRGSWLHALCRVAKNQLRRFSRMVFQRRSPHISALAISGPSLPAA